MPAPASLYFNTFQSGYYPNRSPLSIPNGHGPDVVWDGLNVMQTANGTWRRRYGITQYSSATFTSDFPNWGYTYLVSGTPRLILDIGSTVIDLTTSARTTVFTKTSSTPVFSLANAGETAYMTDPGGQGYKRIGTGTAKVWGITAPSADLTYSLVAAGTHDSKIGYRYVYVYGDSTDGHISSASPILTLGETTPADYTFNNKTVRLTVTYTTQARVDEIDIYRTTDGGSVFFYLDTIANNTGGGTTTYDDAAEDDALNDALLAPLDGINDPPPNLDVVVSHQGRLWGFVDTFVYYSTGPETFNGVAEESWDPLNFFPVPTDVTALAPTSQGILVFTLTDIYLVRGSSPDDFSIELLRSRLGTFNQRCVATDGDVVYFISGSKEIIRITDRVENIGADLVMEDLMVFFDRRTKLFIHREGTNGKLYFVIGSNAYTFNLATETWNPPWSWTGAKEPFGSFQTDSETFKVLLTTTSGTNIVGTWYLDRSVNADITVAFTAYLIFGSMVLAPPGQQALLKSIFLEGPEDGSDPIVSILPQDYIGTPNPLDDPVNEPPTLDAPTHMKSLRYYPETISSYVSLGLRHLLVKVLFVDEDEPNELFSLGVTYEPLES